jgi:uncharacterized protein YraI
MRPFLVFLLSSAVASATLTASALAQVRSNCVVEVVGRVRGSQVNMRSGPGTNFSAPSFVLVGQYVNMLNYRNGERVVDYDRAGSAWYFVEYEPSRTRGWIREDLLSNVCS